MEEQTNVAQYKRLYDLEIYSGRNLRLLVFVRF